ncbi:MAG: PAS domain S-box protein [Rubrivivax sp.]|nr:PAS domain S-box protein [Rubrivivax sp.]
MLDADVDAEAIAEQELRPAPPRARDEPRPALPRQMTRAFLVVVAVACAAGGLLVLLLARQASGSGALMAVPYAVLALCSALAIRLPDDRITPALTLVSMVLTVLLAGTAIALGWGSAAPALPALGLLVCLLCAAAGWRAGALLAVVAAAAVLAVALIAPPVAGEAAPSTAFLIGTQLIAIAAGLAGGVMISQVVARHARSAHEREQHFRRLLALAADAYWEIDHDNCLVAVTDQHQGSGARAQAVELGLPPWDMPNFGCDAETLDRLLADLGSRVPFRDLPITWTDDDGGVRAYLASGEPRYDERGVFTGYWGVARDVTDVSAAREALAATETRYQELFTRIPTPLVLHRSGRVIDANPAAVAMFGHADLQAMLGSDLLTAYESGDSRERARRRMELLQSQRLGSALPVADYRLLVRGRRIAVRATGVRVDADGGPAMLAIFVDDTERLAAEQAVRRSEAMLSHLVATSPDLITLTEMANGRFAMVNHTFERLIGWTAAEAVGRASTELGVWASAEDHEHFMALMHDKGEVTDLATRFVTKSGATISMLVSAARFVMDRRDYMVINARDVTDSERERLERAAILANASIGIAVTRGRRFVLANRHFEQIYGWEPGALIGQAGQTVWLSDEDYAEVRQLVGPALGRGEAVELERRGRRKDGSTFLARVRGRAIDPERPAEGGTVWIVEDVTERRQFELALARARDDAEAASRAKSAFLANTSHELRTPLNGMIGLARLARAPETAEPQRLQYLDQIAESAQSLAGIISDILDLSKIEAGKLHIEATVFDLGDLLRALQRTYATLTEARPLELHFEIAPEIEGAVSGDPLRVRQIITNFLSNALKFTAAGHVHVVASRPAGAGSALVRIEVSDTGPGIDEAIRARLFKPFTQADESTTRRYGGTGLGLSICHELASIMGGAVGVDSQPGHGSTFWAELPLPCSQAPLPTVTDDNARGLEGARVLMVEDNPVNMMIAVAMLERWGVEVAQAHNGREAVAEVHEAVAAGRPFDAVLMDVQMPVMSGHEATRTLRAGVAGHDLPIIALTAAALVTERDEALRAGMNDFLTKPVDAEKLHATLLRWCSGGGASA